MIDFADYFEVQQRLTEFTWFADRGDGDGLAALFMSDAVLTVGGVELLGRDAIANDCYRRFATGPRKTRHLWCNLRIEKLEDRGISTTAVQMTFEETTPEKPVQLRMNDIFDTFRRDEVGSWRFASRIIRREMALAFPVSTGTMRA